MDGQIPPAGEKRTLTGRGCAVVARTALAAVDGTPCTHVGRVVVIRCRSRVDGRSVRRVCPVGGPLPAPFDDVLFGVCVVAGIAGAALPLPVCA